MGNYEDAPWVILSYLLTYMSKYQHTPQPLSCVPLPLTTPKKTGFAVGFSKLSDVYGRRNLLAVAWVTFSGSSIWCALAGSMWQLFVSLCVCRVSVPMSADNVLRQDRRTIHPRNRGFRLVQSISGVSG